MASVYEYTKDQFAELLAGEPRYRVEQVWHGLWTEGQALDDITTIPKTLRARLAEQFVGGLEVVNDVQSDHGATRKWVFRLADGSTIETVLMGYEDRVTVCVSSQAGCAMGCTFCATGQAGFTRHLTAGEVLEQVMFAVRAAAPVERRLYGDGRTARQLQRDDERRAASPRVPGTLGAPPHRVDRRRSAGD
jgi:23S rRNA (adenine2503-C2)-methyltransferase